MRGRKGFLLLEIIVSIALVTAVLLFVARVYSTSKNAIERSRTLFKYGLLLEEKMFDFEEHSEIEKGYREEEFRDHKNYFWAVNAIQISDEEPINLVTLDVFENKGPSLIKYSLTTYLKNKMR